MTDKNPAEEELQDPGKWDLDNAEEQQPEPARPSRAVVSVAFSREDFDRVALFAENNGLKISEMIRNAALDEVNGRMRTIYIDATVVGTGTPWSIAPDPSLTFEVAYGTPTPDVMPA